MLKHVLYGIMCEKTEPVPLKEYIPYKSKLFVLSFLSMKVRWFAGVPQVVLGHFACQLSRRLEWAAIEILLLRMVASYVVATSQVHQIMFLGQIATNLVLYEKCLRPRKQPESFSLLMNRKLNSYDV